MPFHCQMAWFMGFFNGQRATFEVQYPHNGNAWIRKAPLMPRWLPNRCMQLLFFQKMPAALCMLPHCSRRKRSGGMAETCSSESTMCLKTGSFWYLGCTTYSICGFQELSRMLHTISKTAWLAELLLGIVPSMQASSWYAKTCWKCEFPCSYESGCQQIHRPGTYIINYRLDVVFCVCKLKSYRTALGMHGACTCTY